MACLLSHLSSVSGFTGHRVAGECLVARVVNLVVLEYLGRGKGHSGVQDMAMVCHHQIRLGLVEQAP